jgi:MYXO-CTERM domain-containing protein
MLDSLTGNGPYLTNVDALALAGGTQDALVQFTSSPAPEPSTVLLGAAGLVLIAFRRRLRGVR